MERRESIRYPLRLPVRLVAVDGISMNIPAYTCNISCSGMLLRCSEALPAGQRVECVIDLYPDHKLRLWCKGQIERSAEMPAGAPDADGTHTVALTLEAFEFIRQFDGSHRP